MGSRVGCSQGPVFPPAPGGTWTAYSNIDMCGQGDVEIIHNWQATTTLEALKSKAEANGYSAITVSSGEPSFKHAALKRFPFQLTPEHCKPISQCCRHPCTIYIYTPPASPGQSRPTDVPPNVDGHYFSFKTGDSPSRVVDRFEARRHAAVVTFYRNGPVGTKTQVNSASARAMESYQIHGTILQGPVSGTIQRSGDILWSHGYTSRLEQVSSPKESAVVASRNQILEAQILSLEESAQRAAAKASATVCRPGTTETYWEQNPSGQLQASAWVACRDELSIALEGAYQWHLASGEMQVPIAIQGMQTVDFNVVALKFEGRHKEHPLRRVSGGSVVHPIFDAPHPWYLERVHHAEFTGGVNDWLTNAFFFRAFQIAILRDGGELGFLAEEFFSFHFNNDFRHSAKKLERRGGVLYEVPSGWKRFALNVKGKYQDGNDWMRSDGTPGEWAVAYHGTKFDAVPKIIREGFRLGVRHGPAALRMKDSRSGQFIREGICCTPNLAVVECFANGEEAETGIPPLTLDGHTVFFALQCRVRPGAIRRPNNTSYTVTNNDEERMGLQGVFKWIVENPADIRPYAVLVRERPQEHQNLHSLARSFASMRPKLEVAFANVPGRIDAMAQSEAEATQMQLMNREARPRLSREEASGH